MVNTVIDTGDRSRADIVPVLAGGGARLPAHSGILAALDELGIHYQQMVGVSGGSIVAALYAAGYPLPSIRDIAADVRSSRPVIFSRQATPVAFSLGPEEKHALYEAGYHTTMEFLPLKMARCGERSGPVRD